MQTKKLIKRVAILLLIAVFSLAGIVACGGADDITGSRSVSGDEDTIVEPDPTGPVTPTDVCGYYENDAESEETKILS